MVVAQRRTGLVQVENDRQVLVGSVEGAGLVVVDDDGEFCEVVFWVGEEIGSVR